MRSDGIVIIPTYNEIENIKAIITAVTGLEKALDVLIIDDGSPDGTASVVKEMMRGEVGTAASDRAQRQAGTGHSLYPWLRMGH